jgi:hypothetical protein
VFATLSVDPGSRTRLCQELDAGHVHGDMPCNRPASVHCRRSGEDVCERHESGHAARTLCGQGEHELIPVPSAGA